MISGKLFRNISLQRSRTAVGPGVNRAGHENQRLSKLGEHRSVLDVFNDILCLLTSVA